MDVENRLRETGLPKVSVNTEEALAATKNRGRARLQRRVVVLSTCAVIVVVGLAVVAVVVTRADELTDLATVPSESSDELAGAEGSPPRETTTIAPSDDLREELLEMASSAVVYEFSQSERENAIVARLEGDDADRLLELYESRPGSGVGTSTENDVEHRIVAIVVVRVDDVPMPNIFVLPDHPDYVPHAAGDTIVFLADESRGTSTLTTDDFENLAPLIDHISASAT